MTAQTFIDKFKPHADSVARVTGIPAESILAQAGLESGWKENPPGLNFFGIKAGKTWTGPTVLLRTKEILSNNTTKFPTVYSITKRSDGKYLYDVQDAFRSYQTPADSFADWAALVKTRFPKAYAARNDKAAFAAALKAGGYATDPDYASKLVAVMNSVEKRLGLPLTAIAAGGSGLALVAVAVGAWVMLKGR